MPLLTAPLGCQERQAVELRRQGLNNVEIAVIMDRSPDHVGVVLSAAKRKGAVFPPLARRPLYRGKVPIARLVQIRTELRRAGYGKHGMYGLIAERVGLTANCVKVRLWTYDQSQKQGKVA
jgi:hypothetical protein